jgi:UDP-N-acetylmuramoylalanine--D-glutamate ligase
MTPVTHAAGQTIALFGLGGSGLATARALRAGGARVIAWDDSETQAARARDAGVETADLRAIDWRAITSFVLAPGVPLTHRDGEPHTHWTVQLARDHGVEIIGDIELFCRERRAIAPDAPFIAITGTNGKSTTTALVAHMLGALGRDAQMGGNIGTAILSLAPPAADRFHVIECSSFQIDLAPSLAPGVGALLNVTPDHLDRHGTIEDYAAIKARLVARADLAVIGVDDVWCAAIAARLPRVEAVSITSEPADGYFARGSALVRARAPATPQAIADIAGVRSLRGAHNLQNALASAAIVDAALGADTPGWPAIAAALRSFPGLPHRLEEIGRVGRALVINDSKATNADSTEKALLSFPGDIHWILGGKPKDGGIAPLAPHFPRIANAYLIGAATEEFAATLDGKAAFERCGTLDVALARAAADAARSQAEQPIILLSPACASYDQFPNFEVRGDRFRALARALPGFVPAGAAEEA